MPPSPPALTRWATYRTRNLATRFVEVGAAVDPGGPVDLTDLIGLIDLTDPTDPANPADLSEPVSP